LNIGTLFSWARSRSYKSGVQPQQSSLNLPGLGVGRTFPPVLQWTALLVLSILLGALLEWLAVPAALFLAPMLSGIAVTAAGGSLRIPFWGVVIAQGLVGCMIANMLPPAMLPEVIAHWPMFLFGVVSVILISGFLGWLMARLRLLPGTTVVWGLSPGASSAMIAMAQAYGADTQFVALMQYLRLVMVAAVASVVARLAGLGGLHHKVAGVWFPPVAWLSLGETLLLAVSGPIAARLLRFPPLSLLVPMFAGVLLSHRGLMVIETPPWLLAMGYALVGWWVGLRFTRPLLIHAAKVLPRMILCILALIVLCGGLAVLLIVFAGIAPLTAYLATSPGGADSVAIIAASSNVDAAFVMSMQTLRFLGVLLAGPALARFVAGLVEKKRASSAR
jgi:membrane AbrB-like protein